MKNNTEIAKQFRKHLKISRGGLSQQYKNTKTNQAFYSGDSMSYRDSVQFSTVDGMKKKAMVQFSKVKPYVNAVKGFMAQNRKNVKYIALMENDILRGLYSTYCNSLKDFIRDSANADQIETHQDGDALIGGYGALETGMTYGEGFATSDPNGQVIMGRIDPLLVGWDPNARETNLLDSRWVYYFKKYALEDALDLFKDSDANDFEAATEDGTGDDNGYNWYANGGRYNKIKELGFDWADESAELVNVAFYQWFEFEKFYRADNPIFKLKNPESIRLAQAQLQAIAQEFPDQDDMFGFDPAAQILTFGEEIKKRLLKDFGEFIEAFEYKRKVYYTAVLSGDHVFTTFKNVCQTGFTIKFKTGDYDAKNKMWTGMVDSMREPVSYYNKALTELMFIIGANSKVGITSLSLRAFEKYHPKWEDEGTHAQQHRKVRFLPEQYFINPYMTIYDNKVVVLLREEKMGFIIESKEFADAQKIIFDMLWNTVAI